MDNLNNNLIEINEDSEEETEKEEINAPQNIKEIKKRGRGRPTKEIKAHKKDIILCPVCDRKFFRNNRYNHNKTKYHILHNQLYTTLKNSIGDKININNYNKFSDIVLYPYEDKNKNISYLAKSQYNFYSSLPNNIYTN